MDIRVSFVDENNNLEKRIVLNNDVEKNVIQDYDINDFKNIVIIPHNPDSYTIEVVMQDNGKGLIDIDFYNDGNSMEVSDEIYFKSKQLDTFIDAVRESIGIGDWCSSIYSKHKHS